MDSRQPNQPNPEQTLFFEEDGYWNEEEDSEESSLELEDEESEGAVFLNEAHHALNKLAQKTHTRSKVDRHPRRADNWH